MNTLEQLIQISDHTLKVQQYWDDRLEKFTRLEMEFQSHILDMRKKQVEIQSDIEKLQTLKHARLTLQREVKNSSNKIKRMEKEVEAIEKDIVTMTRLMSPSSVYTSRIGRHWKSLFDHLGIDSTMIPKSSSDVFKKSEIDPQDGVSIGDKVSGDFITYCRYNSLLVKPGTPTYEILVTLVTKSANNAIEKIEKTADILESETSRLDSILSQHWTRQGT